MGKHLLVILLAALVSSCSSAPKRPAVKATYAHEDPRIGTYVSSGPGFATSSYWIEGPKGLILIDTQFLLSAAEEALTLAESTTGKKVELAIVLHPNPDKFNGTDLYRKRGIKVVTSEQVRKLIPEVHKLRKAWFYDRFKPDYPAELTPPESFGRETTELSAGGITVKAHVLGSGCSGAHVAVQFEGHLFPGDLVTNDFHSWLELGLLDEWTRRIEELQELEPDFVHPGRGPSGTDGLLDQQLAYLETVRKIVAREMGPKVKDGEAAQERALEAVQEAYPGYRFSLFVKNGMEALWERSRLATRTGKSSRWGSGTR